MNWIKTMPKIRRAVASVVTGMLLLINTAAQQTAKIDGWQTYAPNGAPFSMRVPETPLPAQGHIFNSAYEEGAYRLFEHGTRSRIYNFEIEKGGKRRFLVSILVVQTTKQRHHEFITDSEVEVISATIGDEVMRSKVERLKAENGNVTRWDYTIKGGVGEDNESDGVVHALTRSNYIVIVVVDYDYAKATATDAEIKTMLDSLCVR